MLTVAVPSFSTLIFAAVKFASGFAFIIAAITASFSPDVSAFKSPTGVFAGLFKVSSALAFFSQTAYTVFAAVTLFKMLASASFASFVAAQPKNLYPTLVGSAGFVTFPPSTFTEVVSLPSPNLPSFASKVTATSSE